MYTVCILRNCFRGPCVHQRQANHGSSQQQKVTQAEEEGKLILPLQAELDMGTRGEAEQKGTSVALRTRITQKQDSGGDEAGTHNPFRPSLPSVGGEWGSRSGELDWGSPSHLTPVHFKIIFYFEMIT